MSSIREIVWVEGWAAGRFIRLHATSNVAFNRLDCCPGCLDRAGCTFTRWIVVGKLYQVGQLEQFLQDLIKQIAGGVETLSSSSTELSAISEQMSQGITSVSDKSTTASAAA